MSKREPTGWITVNGKRVPLFEGESKEEAVKNALGKDNKEKQIEANKKEADRKNAEEKQKDADKTNSKGKSFGNVSDKEHKQFTKAMSEANKKKAESLETKHSDADKEKVKSIIQKAKPGDKIEVWKKGMNRPIEEITVKDPKEDANKFSMGGKFTVYVYKGKK